MEIKAADSRRADIAALERLLDRTDVSPATRRRIEAEIRQVEAGQRGERDAAYDIELYFGRSPNWATIHDLRIDVDGQVPRSTMSSSTGLPRSGCAKASTSPKGSRSTSTASGHAGGTGGLRGSPPPSSRTGGMSTC